MSGPPPHVVAASPLRLLRDHVQSSKQLGLIVRTSVGRFVHHKLEDKVLAIAFVHEQNNCTTIILINQSSGEKTVTVSGSGLPSWIQ